MSCSTYSSQPQPISLERIKFLRPDFDESGKLIGFKYGKRVCVKKFLWACRQEKTFVYKFGADDIEAMRIIKARDMVLREREKP